MRCLPQGSYNFWTYFDPLVYSKDCINNSVYFMYFLVWLKVTLHMKVESGPEGL